MRTDLVENLGALHLYDGRLWLGRASHGPIKHFACEVDASGLHTFGAGPVNRRHTSWDEMSSIEVDLHRWPYGYGRRGPFGGLRVDWTVKNDWDRYWILLPSDWEGECDDVCAHAVATLPKALCRSTALREQLATAESIAGLLAALATAPDPEAVDEILAVA